MHAVLPSILLFLRFFPTGTTGFSSRGGVAFLAASVCMLGCKIKCMCLGVYCVIVQELWLLFLFCAETVTTSFLGHNRNFSLFSDFYMVFLLCLNFNFYAPVNLLLCFGESLEVVGGWGFEF